MIIKSINKIFFRVAQNVPILIEKFNVAPEVAQQVFELMQPLEGKNKKFITNWIKKNPPKDTIGVQALQDEINRQINFVAQEEMQKKEELGVSEEVMAKIKKTTPIEKFQKWIIDGFKNNAIVETDLLGLKGQLRRFKKLVDKGEITGPEAEIASYKSGAELNVLLSKYLSSDVIQKLPPPEMGYTVMEDQVIDGQNVKLLSVHKKEAMEAISRMIEPPTSWCVGNGSFNIYPSPIYYCFLINGRPEILVHPASGQLKNVNDRPVSNAIHVKLISGMIEKYQLVDPTKMVAPYTTNSMYGSRDQNAYNASIESISAIEKNVDNKEETIKVLESNIDNFSLLPENKKINYLDWLASKIEKIDIYTFNIVDLELLCNYLEQNNDTRISKLEAKVVGWLKSDTSNFIFYHGRIPDFLKTANTSAAYKEIVDKYVDELSKGAISSTKVDSWFKSKFNERAKEGKEVPKEWVNAVAKSIVDTGKVPTCAYEWVQNLFSQGPMNATIEKAVTERLVLNGDMSAIKNIPVPAEWVERTRDKILSQPGLWQDRVVSSLKEKGFAPRLFASWISKQLSSLGAQSPIFEAIQHWIVQYLMAPPFAEKWIKSQLSANPDPKIIDAICKCLLENGQLPEFAVEWCKKEFDNGSPNPILVKGFIACGRKYGGRIPTFALPWFRQNMTRLIAEQKAEQQKEQEERQKITETASINNRAKIMSYASFFNDNVIRKLP